MAAQQSYENHAKIVPAYHYLTFGLLAINLVYRIQQAVTRLSAETLVSLGLAIAVVMVCLWARVFALKVQDRVIRLEMRLRLQALAPDLSSRFHDFTLNQLCSLRFAGDAELPDLARKVLAEKLDDRKTIKQMVRDWQADFLRV